MIVVADASPLQYLILIEETEILPALYGGVLIPPAVLSELTRTQTPETIRRWIVRRPAWLQVRAPLLPLPAFPAKLGPGEREAIALAEELHADILLVDDCAARREAERRLLPVQGTLGLLSRAAERNLADLPTAIARLRRTNFRASGQLLQLVLDQEARRKKL
jgi:predicted nucleic acid-binding protein